MRPLFLVLRPVGAIAIAAAIVGQLSTTSAFWDSRGITDHTFLYVNFFSFFTIDSNVLAVLVLGVGTVLLARSGRGAVEPRWFGVLRGATTAYMAVTGVVYNLLLRGIDVAEGAVLPWSNEVLHVVGPVLLVLDWLLAPGRARLRFADLGIVVAFPLLWSVYTLLRGPTAPDPIGGRTGWYPYPFLDPRIAESGYLSVAGYVLLIAGIIVLAGCAVVAVSRRAPGLLRRG